MKKTVIAVIVLATLLAPTLALAASPWTSGQTYGEKVKGKLEFGLKNVLTGWTAILTTPATSFKENKASVFSGLATGAYNAVVYTLGGVLHTATFFIPQIDIPLPGDGIKFGGQ